MVWSRSVCKSLVASACLNWSTQKLFKGKYFKANSALKIKHGKSKGMQKKNGCMEWIEKSVIRDHFSASLGKPRNAATDLSIHAIHL